MRGVEVFHKGAAHERALGVEEEVAEKIAGAVNISDDVGRLDGGASGVLGQYVELGL